MNLRKNRIFSIVPPLVSRAVISSLKYFLFLRLLTSLLVLIAAIWIPPQTLPPNSTTVQSYLTTIENQGVFMKWFVAPWYRWDTVHYLDISDFGYSYDKSNTIWPPLYSLLARWVSYITSSSLVAALIVSNLSSIIAWILLYLWVTDVWEEKIAQDTLTWVVIFPTAFIWMAGYSESLFLALSVGCLYAFRKSRWILAGILGAGAVLTRWQGIILFIPIAWVWFRSTFIQKRIKFGQAFPLLIPIVLMGIAGMAYILYIRFGLGFSWPWEGLSNYSQHLAWPWEGWIGTFTSLTSFTFSAMEAVIPFLTRFYDLFIVSGAIIILIRQYKRIPVEYLLYAVAGILLMLIKIDRGSQLTDVSRYILGIFPVFVVLALTLKKGAKLAWFAFSLLSLAILTILFYEWAWMA